LADRLGDDRAGGVYYQNGRLVVAVTDSGAAQTIRNAGGTPKRVARSTAELASIRHKLDQLGSIPNTAWGIETRGGLRSKTDKRAFQDGSFVLEGTLPATWPNNGQVAWAGDESLTRPMVGAEESYETLVGGNADGKPYLTVTGARLGEMSVATSRGPAVAPAWLFTLDGYDSPLKRAAAIPSKLSPPPIKRAYDVPGLPLNRLVQISAGGRSVTVAALHGECDNGPAVNVLETSGSVVLSNSVKERKDGDVCTKQGKLQQVTVRLDRPVGDRVLLDALTGKPVPFKPPHGRLSS
jgi:hypothetical protein